MEDWMVIPLVVVGAYALYDFYTYKTKMKELETKLNDVEKVQIVDELESLKYRVVVLESIVAARGYESGEKIESLKTV